MNDQPGTESVLTSSLADFRRSVEITKDVRFQANLRLSQRQRLSSYIVSLLSLFVIGLSLFPNIYELKPYQSQILLACSIVLSVFVIFTSLIDGAQNFFHQGELLHQCARQIATVHHEVKNIDPAHDPVEAAKQLDALQKRYQKALDDCPINHENEDYFKEIATKPWLFPKKYEGRWEWSVKAKHWAMHWTLSHAWMAPHIVAVVAIAAIVFCSIIGSPMAGAPAVVLPAATGH